ncbi:hypothetical protein DL766_007044 [Monosporascus sp. MC13-8B]|nr:hypothetical protein DL763_004743 [Monosporascus cannonballus]RYP25449.1 hypothetical protein DL766_007044 [Monosporascus sp. MC13-8B]
MVVCNDPTELRRVLSVSSGFRRSPWYSCLRLDPSKDNVLCTPNNKVHQQLRSYLKPGYTLGSDHQEQLVDEQIMKLVQLVEREYVSTKGKFRTMDLVRVSQYLVHDVISSVGFGRYFGYLDANDDLYGAIHIVKTITPPLMVAGLFHSIFVTVAKSPFMKPFLPKPSDKQGLGVVLGIIKGQVEKRYGAKKIENRDVLQSFVDSSLPRDMVESECMVQIVAGTATTATAISSAIFHVSSNPGVYRKLQEEIDAATKTVSRPVISDQQAKDLPYLQAVIREALRIWPPSAALQPHRSDEDELICGVKVPAQTDVAWAPFTLMRNKAVFGEDADMFNPDRWIDAEPGRFREMELTQGMVFFSGSRWECMGKKLAYMEITKSLFELFRRYDLAMLNPVEPFTWKNYAEPNMLLLTLALLPTLSLTAIVPVHSYTRCQRNTQNPLEGCPPRTLYVSQSDERAQFHTIQSAITSIPNNTVPYTILVAPGTYTEQLNVTRQGPLTLLGMTDRPWGSGLYADVDGKSRQENDVHVYWNSANHDAVFPDNVYTGVLTIGPNLNATLTGSGPTGFPVPEDTPFGCTDFRAYNIDFRNEYTPYANGPAHALGVSRANAGFYSCGFYSYQDTVYIGKLGNAYFYDSVVAGQTDFLYGFGTLYIEKSTLALRGCGGGITAWKGTNTTFHNKYGVYISDSRVVAANSSIASEIEDKCSLGRPWNEGHRSVFMNTYFDPSILPAGYTPWKGQPNGRIGPNTTMAVYHVYGPGYDGAAAEASDVTKVFHRRQVTPFRRPINVFMTPTGKQPNIGWIDPYVLLLGRSP